MTAKTDLASLNCSLARALSLVGDSWSLLILRDAFIGASRFGEFRMSLGVARNILSNRLDRLVAAGVLARTGAARRPRYVLTDKGRALLPALVALMQWGDDWTSDGRPPVALSDRAGRPLSPIQARAGGEEVDSQSIRFSSGPGATQRTKAFLGRFARALE